MIYGVDLSHHNEMALERSLRLQHICETAQFAGLKLSEGKTSYWSEILLAYLPDSIPLILYHYARPEKYSAKTEAEAFCRYFRNIVEAHPGRTFIPALDWEGTALKYPASWISEFAAYVHAEIGVPPMIYMQKSALMNYGEAALNANMGLWLARWHDDPAQSMGVAPYRLWAVHQYSSTPLDLNRFNGTAAQLEKYGVRG